MSHGHPLLPTVSVQPLGWPWGCPGERGLSLPSGSPLSPPCLWLGKQKDPSQPRVVSAQMGERQEAREPRGKPDPGQWCQGRPLGGGDLAETGRRGVSRRRGKWGRRLVLTATTWQRGGALSPWKWQAALPGWDLGWRVQVGGGKMEKEEAEGTLGSDHRGWVSWTVQSGLPPEGPGEPWTDGGELRDKVTAL